jgi:hypothetical protein
VVLLRILGCWAVLYNEDGLRCSLFNSLFMRYSLFVVMLCSLASCKKLTTEKTVTFEQNIFHLHIICDARETGVVEPWLFEVGGDDVSFNINSTYLLYDKAKGYFILDSAVGTATVAYLLDVPLLDMSNLVQVIEPTTIADKQYKHYEFRQAMTPQPLFRITDAIHYRPDGVYKIGYTFFPVIVSTNVRIEEAVSKINAGMQNSVMSKKIFVLYR